MDAEPGHYQIEGTPLGMSVLVAALHRRDTETAGQPRWLRDHNSGPVGAAVRGRWPRRDDDVLVHVNRQRLSRRDLPHRLLALGLKLAGAGHGPFLTDR
jgi:hypothetical protein